jgi:hypothetical protein
MKLRGRGGDAMRLDVDAPLRAGDVDIEPGTYDVTVDEASSTIVLHREGAEILRAEAFARGSKVQVRKPSAKLRKVVDEPRRLLVARTPPSDEWVLSLDERA